MLAIHEDRIAQAVERLGSENAFEVLARARQLEAQGRRVVHMEIGEPDFDTPEHIKRAGGRGPRTISHTHYTPSAGIPELRATIAEYASRFRHISPPYTRENVVVSPGAKPIIWNVLSALLESRRRFRLLRSGLSGVRVLRELPASERPCDAAARVAQLAHGPRRAGANASRTRRKAIVINSPHNPTGGVLTRGDLETIAEMAQRHDFIVIADEIYSRNFYLDSEFVSIAALAGMRERTIIVDGFSKAYAMTGWRLGLRDHAANDLAKT